MTRRDAAMPAKVRKLRCAVYTRKSTDEGLDKEFNSLDAQRAACESYVASQRSEGWVLVHDRYDDGGVSGGTLERPALKRLLADIEAGLVDVVLVYKVDRLSRSLMDFAKLVETFEAHEVTFVAITQSLNTTTSMGRLTLNMLLSFAQYERELIGERVRDKIAASRARGMWMGGPVPLGYRVENRKLLVDEAAAATVRRVFEVFAEIGSAMRVLPILRSEGLLTKTGRPFDKGALHKLLANRVYLGEAVHKGQSYPGEHAAIISRDLWDRVHAIMQESPRERASKSRATATALLRGLLFGPDGRAMSPTHTRKRGRLYRYYVSQAVLQGGANDAPHRRLPAGEIEGLVMAQVRALLRQPEVVVGTWRASRAEAPDVTEAEVRDALGRLDPLWDELFPGEQERIVRLLVERVDLTNGGAQIRLNLEGLAGLARDMAAKEAIAA
ncbi:MAG: recombinase family protein [Alphaproteobacteria bacterium]|nr:recombinase family protein [Alphaproteobacteria bacterium]